MKKVDLGGRSNLTSVDVQLMRLSFVCVIFKVFGNKNKSKSVFCIFFKGLWLIHVSFSMQVALFGRQEQMGITTWCYTGRWTAQIRSYFFETEHAFLGKNPNPSALRHCQKQEGHDGLWELHDPSTTLPF